MPKKTDHPGVTYRLYGNYYHLRFFHPWLDFKQVKKSCHTSDEKQAEKYAIELAGVLKKVKDGYKGDPSEGCSDIVKGIWNPDDSSVAARPVAEAARDTLGIGVPLIATATASNIDAR